MNFDEWSTSLTNKKLLMLGIFTVFDFLLIFTMIHHLSSASDEMVLKVITVKTSYVETSVQSIMNSDSVVVNDTNGNVYTIRNENQEIPAGTKMKIDYEKDTNMIKTFSLQN